MANMIRRIYAYTCVEDGFWIINSTCEYGQNLSGSVQGTSGEF